MLLFTVTLSAQVEVVNSIPEDLDLSEQIAITLITQLVY